jgi:FAD/FMN-containing dehydrogenase
MQKLRLSRRAFMRSLAGATASALVLGFDPRSRSWVTWAQPASPAPFDQLPRLDGRLVLDEATRAAFARDFGQIVSPEPVVVLEPGSVQDVVEVIRFANSHGLRVAMRGSDHSMLGQSQVEAGIVIDSRPLDSIRIAESAGGPVLEVGPGAQWGAVLDVANARKLTPPVNVDWMTLSVGGTLATGGIGGTTWRDGFQVDHVLELQVVTGDGQLVTCSDAQNADLFNAVLAGMGQCGVIVRAVIPLVPAPTNVLFFTLTYTDLAAAAADYLSLIESERFAHLDGRSAVQQGGGFTYIIEAGAFYDAPEAPDETALLDGLGFDSRNVADQTYEQYYRRLAGVNLSRGAHPWTILYLPAAQFVAYASRVYATPDEFAASAPRFAVYRRAPIRRPLSRVPDDDLIFRFQLSRNPPEGSPDVDSLLAMNRVLFERARDFGGTRMTWATIPFRPDDWAAHYGEVWPMFRDAKQRFDPNHVLTPGPGIFPQP